jgi:uncharacterized membrane protein
MTWRGSTDFKDRIFGALLYLLPLFYLFYLSPFGKSLLNQFEFLNLIALPLIPLLLVYGLLASIPIIGSFTGLLIFVLIFALVVRNPRISHFIRFNAMQSILLDILLSLLALILSFVLGSINLGLLTETLFNTIFLGTLVACIYGIVQSAMGKYPEIPGISEAAYSQVPW